MKEGQTWRLGDNAGGETIALILRVGITIEVLVVSSTLPDCRPGTTEHFSPEWFHETGSLLS